MTQGKSILENVIAKIYACKPVSLSCHDPCEHACMEFITPENVEMLLSEVNLLTRERDALELELRRIAHNATACKEGKYGSCLDDSMCRCCKHSQRFEGEVYPFFAMECDKCSEGNYSEWQWRGVQEVDNERN